MRIAIPDKQPRGDLGGTYDFLKLIAPKNTELSRIVEAFTVVVVGETVSALHAIKAELGMPTAVWGSSRMTHDNTEAAATEINFVLSKLINDIETSGSCPPMKRARSLSGMLSAVTILLSAKQASRPAQGTIDPMDMSNMKGRREVPLHMDDEMKGVQGSADVNVSALRSLTRDGHVKL
tara:strand:+ start:2152 stop:2688 length:537 start_codon:yes stop_codon:yes gene_type:complete